MKMLNKNRNYFSCKYKYSNSHLTDEILWTNHLVHPISSVKKADKGMSVDYLNAYVCMRNNSYPCSSVVWQIVHSLFVKDKDLNDESCTETVINILIYYQSERLIYCTKLHWSTFNIFVESFEE